MMPCPDCAGLGGKELCSFEYVWIIFFSVKYMDLTLLEALRYTFVHLMLILILDKNLVVGGMN